MLYREKGLTHEGAEAAGIAEYWPQMGENWETPDFPDSTW